MTDNEKSRLVRGLFLTTGIILGLLVNDVNDGTGGILFALLSAVLFFSASFVASKSIGSKFQAYSGALVVWLLMYKLLQLL
ncbi:hypothetical protein [Hymenobacter sedentarius]|uniref:hypothetical protein n=1 Tax=Hymenobacter sedentarius TaxID=1411621 RepID=UPI0012FD272C|nr:hypothetical protein [Hymenobacter sedentarius]